jgi:hypothetical protein
MDRIFGGNFLLGTSYINPFLIKTTSFQDYALAITNLVILILAFILVTGSYTATIFYLWRTSKRKGIYFV